MRPENLYNGASAAAERIDEERNEPTDAMIENDLAEMMRRPERRIVDAAHQECGEEYDPADSAAEKRVSRTENE